MNNIHQSHLYIVTIQCIYYIAIVYFDLSQETFKIFIMKSEYFVIKTQSLL